MTDDIIGALNVNHRHYKNTDMLSSLEFTAVSLPIQTHRRQWNFCGSKEVIPIVSSGSENLAMYLSARPRIA